MKCEHRRTSQTTTWQAYEPRRPGIVQSKLIQKQTCLDCPKETVSRTEGIRAVRERSETLASAPDALQSVQEHEALKTLLSAATEEGENTVAHAGTWMRPLQRLVGATDVAPVLQALMAQGLITIETSRTRKRHDAITAVLWPNEQYNALRKVLDLKDAAHLSAAEELLQGALYSSPRGPYADLLVEFWADQLEQLRRGKAQILEARGTVILTSASNRYLTVLHRTLEIAEIQSALKDPTTRIRAIDTAEVVEAILGEPLTGTLSNSPTVLRIHGRVLLNPRLAAESPDYLPLEIPQDSTLLFVQSELVFRELQRTPAPENLLIVHMPTRLTGELESQLRLLADRASRIFVWCDLDPVGLQLATAMVAGLPARAEPFLMDLDAWVHVPEMRPLNPVRLRLTKRIAARAGPFRELAGRMVEQAAWIPQEALLARAMALLGFRAEPQATTKDEAAANEVRMSAMLVDLIDTHTSTLRVTTSIVPVVRRTGSVYVEALSPTTIKVALNAECGWMAHSTRHLITAVNLASPRVAVAQALRKPLAQSSTNLARLEVSHCFEFNVEDIAATWKRLDAITDENLKKAIEAFDEGNATPNHAAMVRNHAAAIEMAVNASRIARGFPALRGRPLDAAAHELTGFPQASFERARVVYNRTKHIDEDEGEKRVYKQAMERIHTTAVDARNGARAVLNALLGA